MPYIPGHKFTTPDAGLNTLLERTYQSAAPGEVDMLNAVEWHSAYAKVAKRLQDGDTYARLRPYLCKTCSGVGIVGNAIDAQPCPACSTATGWLDELNAEGRMAVLRQYCRSCGDKNPSCQCWNDD